MAWSYCLILDVVKVKTYAGFVRPVSGKECLQEHRHQRRLPVVAVQDIRKRIQMRKQFERRFRKEGESLAVIVGSIQPVAFEVVAVVDKIISHAAFPKPERPAYCFSTNALHVESTKLHSISYVSLIWRQRKQHGYLHPPFVNRAAEDPIMSPSPAALR